MLVSGYIVIFHTKDTSILVKLVITISNVKVGMLFKWSCCSAVMQV
jgi:hypothetical protein